MLHATDSLQPVAVSGTSARRERDKDSPTYVPYRRRKYLRRREADAHLIESKEKRRGRTDVGGKTRKRIKAWLERERIARPHQTAMECKALAEAKFTVRITRANFYATYWAYTHPKEPA